MIIAVHGDGLEIALIGMVMLAILLTQYLLRRFK